MSGGSNGAQRQAQQAEAAREASIRNTQSAVNRVYNDPRRQADIADYIGATREYLTNDLNRQKGDTDRELKFAMARSGQIGGSTQVDQQQRVGENYSRGILEAERRAQGAGADLQAQDQENRARLISLATSGLDATTAAQQAAAGMRSSLEAGKATSLAGGMGDAFSSFGQFLRDSRDAAARRRANQETGFSLYGSTQYGGG